MLRLRKLHSHMIIREKKSKKNTIQYTGGVDRNTTTAGSQLLWARIKEFIKDLDTRTPLGGFMLLITMAESLRLVF